MAAKVLSGARAVLGFYDGTGFSPVGIFSDVSYGVTYDVQPAWILGRYSAASLDYTAVEVVHITANGYRIIDHGWFNDARFPSLAQLMSFTPMTMQIIDRQNPKRSPCGYYWRVQRKATVDDYTHLHGLTCK